MQRSKLIIEESIKSFLFNSKLTIWVVWLLCFCFAAFAPGSVQQAHAAAGDPAVQVFYVPVPETAISAAAEANDPTLNYDVIHTVVGMSLSMNDTVIYYDHWEDGLEPDLSSATPTQASTEIWGDGNAANGCAPNVNGVPVTCSDGNDVLGIGDVVILENDVPTDTRTDPPDILFDGGDKIGSTFLMAVTRSAWPVPDSRTLLAGAVEVLRHQTLGHRIYIPHRRKLHRHV